GGVKTPAWRAAPPPHTSPSETSPPWSPKCITVRNVERKSPARHSRGVTSAQPGPPAAEGWLSGVATVGGEGSMAGRTCGGEEYQPPAPEGQRPAPPRRRRPRPPAAHPHPRPPRGGGAPGG